MRTFLSFSLLLVFVSILPAQTPVQPEDPGAYVPRIKDKVLEEIKEANKEKKKEAEARTEEIQSEWKERKKKEKEDMPQFKAVIGEMERPASLEDFTKVWHNPPVAQYLTGTCWSFSTTSYFESEVHRLTGKSVKLSEIYTAYYEYVEKVRSFVQTRGNTYLGEGSEGNAVPRIWKAYGIVPLQAYPGVLAENGRHDHSVLFDKIEAYLDYVKEHDYWNEEEVVSVVRVYLNETLGPPPETFTYDGKTWTPLSFLKDYLKLDLDAYVEVMSTLRYPFWTRAKFEAPDNWWHSEDYLNLPLDTFYAAIRRSIENGYSVAIGGDVSEPAYSGMDEVAFIPSFDIPQSYINQTSREFRIANNTTEDDHGIHLVGYTRIGDHDWFLIKDSGRSSRWGPHEGYYFYRDDYVRLKMLTFTVHRDMLTGELNRLVTKTES
ncbi:MAG TPA: C1 family peptidase [Thermoanaerobaculia bacterium]|nr:C1 family peptidase [Thermoanaerobaculia bacterium]HUM29527.1 C1 family peptidase [Thermoanaerobaculia bacterium]HXK67910.1 C1 family peptidase [Thermoanaerobaculia bacterium]